MSEQVKLPLSEPIPFGDKSYTELVLRKMKAKDLVAGDLVTGKSRRAMAIFASMCGVPIQVIEELDVDDFEALGELATPLMGKSAKALVDQERQKALKASEQ